MRREISLAAVAVSATALSTLALAASTLQVTSNSWAPAGDLLEARAGAAAVLLYDGSILVTGGMNDAGVTTTTERYHPAPRQFVRARPMDTPRANHTSTLLPDGRVLVAGGMGAHGRALKVAELYDPAVDVWTPVAPLHLARAGHTATALHDGRVVIAGGNDGSVSLRSIEIYNPDTGTFESSSARMSDARTGHAAALASDRTLLITGGFDGINVLSSAEIYDPFFDMVMPGPPLSTPRVGHSATTMVDGKVLVAGGSSRASELASAEVYNPTTRAFSSTGNSMIVARQRHQALLLPHNGQILIVGGTGGGVAVPTAEVYVAWQGPGGTFYRTNTPAVARIWSAAAALSFVPGLKRRSGPGDGLLLLTGGSRLADATAPFKSSELYGFATVKTDKADYAPGTPVTITGGGWVPGETVILTLQESPGFDEHQPFSTVADEHGNIVNTAFAPDEHDLNVLFYLTASGSASQAQTTFTDSLNAMSATLDGRTTVTLVRSGASTANVNVTAASTTWHSTGWRIATSTGALTCENTPDHNSDGTFSESFAVTAPAGVGTYNVYFAAFSDDACATNPSATFTLSNAVVVDAAVPMTDTTSPTVASIDLSTPSPTNMSSVSWTVIFSEAVTGVGPSDFSLVWSGVVGTPAITAVSGSGTSYTVTASTGTRSGTIGLNLVDDDSIVDAAGNALGGPGTGNGSLPGAVFTLDRTLTPQVIAASKTYDGTTTATIVTRTLAGNIVSGDVVSLTGGTATFDTKAVGSGKTVTATGLILTGADATKYVLSSTGATTIAAITEASLTVTGVTANNRPFDGTAVATLNTESARLVGIIAGDAVALLASHASGTFANASVGTGKPVVVAGLATSGADAVNYTLTDPTGVTADISPSTSSTSASASTDPSSNNRDAVAAPASANADSVADGSASVGSETRVVAARRGTGRSIRSSPSWVPAFVPTPIEAPTGPATANGSGVIGALPRVATASPTGSDDDTSATTTNGDEQLDEATNVLKTKTFAPEVLAAFGQAVAPLTVKSDYLSVNVGLAGSIAEKRTRGRSLAQKSVRIRTTSRPPRSRSAASPRAVNRSSLARSQSPGKPVVRAARRPSAPAPERQVLRAAKRQSASAGRPVVRAKRPSASAGGSQKQQELLRKRRPAHGVAKRAVSK